MNGLIAGDLFAPRTHSPYCGQYADRPIADAGRVLHPGGASVRNRGIRIRFGSECCAARITSLDGRPMNQLMSRIGITALAIAAPATFAAGLPTNDLDEVVVTAQ